MPRIRSALRIDHGTPTPSHLTIMAQYSDVDHTEPLRSAGFVNDGGPLSLAPRVELRQRPTPREPGTNQSPSQCR
jgi:hypothetical protein